MDANTERMPGDAEAAAAAAGMSEVYGRPAATHAVGDAVWFSPTVGAMPRQGRVEFADWYGLSVRDDEGQLHTIALSQVAEF
jgi:hypothetical protein